MPVLTDQEVDEKRTEIRAYIERNGKELNLSAEEKDHIAECLLHLWRWYKEDYPVGEFISAVIRNDFKAAVALADETNRRALILYVWYPYSEMPDGWAKKGAKRN